MQNNSQKRGIALGAVFALVSSLFIGVVPASANTAAVDGAKIAMTPLNGAVDNFNGTILESFPLQAYLLPGASNSNFVAQKVRVEVTRVSGNVDILVTSSGLVHDGTSPASYSLTSNIDPNIGVSATCTNTCSSLSSVVYSNQTTASQFTVMGLVSDAARFTVRAYTTSPQASLSGVTAVVTIKLFVENPSTNDREHQTLEDFVTKTVTLHAVSAVPVTSTTIAQMNSGDTTVTASATVGALNFRNLNGTYYLHLASNTTTYRQSAAAGSTTTTSDALTSNQMVSRSGVISQSFTVSSSSGVNAADSLSGRVMYVYSGSAVARAMGSTFSMVVTNPGVTELFAEVVGSDNSTMSSGIAKVRTNTTTTFKIGAKTGSASISTVVNVRFSSTPSLTLNSKQISFNGGSATTSWPSLAAPLTVTTAADGFATFTLKNEGFVDGNDYVLTAFIGNISKSLTVHVEAASLSVVPTYTTYQSGVGETTSIVYDVEDQWGVASSRTDLRLAVTRGGTGFNYSPTLSYVAVSGGTATVAFVPQPATATGSATVDVDLQVLNQNTGGYDDLVTSVDQVTINVSSVANAFGTGLAASRSASISYFPNTVSWVAVSGKVVNTGSMVVVSGTDLVFRDNAGKTYSGTVTVRAGSGPTYTFDVAGTKAGTFTMTLTNGTATTTSLVIVDPASHSAGAAISFDTTEITAGKTKIVVGKLVDANGNAVDTTRGAGTASITVTYAGSAGIPVGTLPTETDANGEFRVSILTSTADAGSFTLTATYLKDGAATAVADLVTKVQSINVVAAAPVEANAVIGSFNGRWAVRVENAKGSVVSVKAGSRWVKFTSLNNNYLFSRKSVVGRTIAVSVWVDGELQNSQTITIK